jgi:hypothetical protein
MESNYSKYLKYKKKYTELKNILSGGTSDVKQHTKINIYPCLPIGSGKSTLRELFLENNKHLGFKFNTEDNFKHTLETTDVNYWEDTNHS